MASPSSLGPRRNVNRSVLTGLVEIFQTKNFDKKLKISSLHTKEFLKWVVEADTATSQQVIGVMTTMMQGRKADSFAFIFAIKNPPLLCEAGTKQVRQAVRASTTMQTCAASDGRLS